MPKREPDPPPPVRPPTLPPDFPDIPQNPGSELQPPPDSFAVADKVAGTTLGSPETPEARAKVELRSRNARLREKINSVLTQHPELGTLQTNSPWNRACTSRLGPHSLNGSTARCNSVREP